jgi:hypothetical protein
MTKSQRTRANETAVSIEDPGEAAVRDAVRAVQTDIQHLLHQHFVDVRNVLKPLVKECVEEARSDSARSARPPQVPMAPQISMPPHAPHARTERAADTPAPERVSAGRLSAPVPLPTYGLALGIAFIVALAGVLTWALMREMPSSSQTQGPPAPLLQAPVPGTLLPAQAAEANFHRALARWGAGYRSGTLKAAITSLVPSAGAQTLDVHADVVEAAKAYLKDPASTTHAEETRLAIALAQVVVMQSNGTTLSIDGRMTWPRIDVPEGSTAPLISDEFAKKYLQPGKLTFADLCGPATGPACTQMIPQVPLAVAAERMSAQ